jgi:RecB family exonuclease
MATTIALPATPGKPAFIKITPSRSEDLLACPRRYKALHIDGLGSIDRAPSKHLSYGISAHGSLHRFYEGGGFKVYGREAMARLLARSWVAEGYASEDEETAFRAQALTMLEAYYDTYADEPTRHLGHELFVQAKFRLDGMGVLLSGKIDRLSVWPDGRLEVIDYKTSGGAPPSPEKLASDMAPFLYYALGRVNNPDYPQIDVTFIYLKTMTRVTALFDPETVAEAKARLTQMVRQIDEGFFPPKPNGHCAWCEVRNGCPAMRREEVDLNDIV